MTALLDHLANRLADRLAGMPTRQVRLVAAGLVLIMLAALFSALRFTFAGLQAVRIERFGLEQQAMQGSTLRLQDQQLRSDIEHLSQQPGMAEPRVAPDELVVQTIGVIHRISSDRQVSLIKIVPSAPRAVMMFEETAFDVEARGSYRELMVWMQAIEKQLPQATVQRFSVQREEGIDKMTMQVHIVTYQIGESKKI